MAHPTLARARLLNALLNEERAIVSDIAGTTRDTIEDEIHLGGITFRFIDTAGLRHTTDVVETMGIKKAHEKIDHARLVLYVFDAAHPPEDLHALLADVKARAGKKPVIALANKVDKGKGPINLADLDVQLIDISAKNKQGIEELQTCFALSSEFGCAEQQRSGGHQPPSF